jgi:hypothetical protein
MMKVRLVVGLLGGSLIEARKPMPPRGVTAETASVD